MVAFRRIRALSIHSIAFLLLTSTLTFAASVTVTPTVTPVGSLYRYSYSITNNTPDDLFDLDIPVPAEPSAVTDIVAPAGFTDAFDSGLGIVSFLEDSSSFGSSSVSGFSFESPAAPVSTEFAAQLLGGSGIYTLSGPTVAPIPEPANEALLGLVGAALLTFSRYRRNAGKRTN